MSLQIQPKVLIWITTDVSQLFNHQMIPKLLQDFMVQPFAFMTCYKRDAQIETSFWQLGPFLSGLQFIKPVGLCAATVLQIPSVFLWDVCDDHSTTVQHVFCNQALVKLFSVYLS